jgi:hypothetical protein
MSAADRICRIDTRRRMVDDAPKLNHEIEAHTFDYK